MRLHEAMCKQQDCGWGCVWTAMLCMWNKWKFKRKMERCNRTMMTKKEQREKIVTSLAHWLLAVPTLPDFNFHHAQLDINGRIWTIRYDCNFDVYLFSLTSLLGYCLLRFSLFSHHCSITPFHFPFELYFTCIALLFIHSLIRSPVVYT